jgi:hypothetical protein
MYAVPVAGSRTSPAAHDDDDHHRRRRRRRRLMKFGHLFAATTASMQPSVREQVRPRERRGEDAEETRVNA